MDRNGFWKAGRFALARGWLAAGFGSEGGLAFDLGSRTASALNPSAWRVLEGLLAGLGPGEIAEGLACEFRICPAAAASGVDKSVRDLAGFGIIVERSVGHEKKRARRGGKPRA